MRKYELTILTKAEMVGEAYDKFVAKIESTVKALGGKVIKSLPMGKKQLAYRIKNLPEANYIEVELELPAETVIQLGKKLDVDRDVVRHLLVSVDK